MAQMMAEQIPREKNLVETKASRFVDLKAHSKANRFVDLKAHLKANHLVDS